MKKRITSKLLLIILFLSLSVGNISAQKAETVKSIPYPLEIINKPVSHMIASDLVRISAAGKTNLFNSPSGDTPVQNAPMILFQPEGDFTLSAKVTGDLQAIYDVAALVVYQDENTWAKFCFENSVEKEPTIVSVVTRIYSDDCNSIPTGTSAYMSVVKKGEEFSFFYSEDKTNWKLIRNFRLEPTDKLKVGFAAHGSRGEGFTAVFTDIYYYDRALDNMRRD